MKHNLKNRPMKRAYENLAYEWEEIDQWFIEFEKELPEKLTEAEKLKSPKGFFPSSSNGIYTIIKEILGEPT